MNQAAIFQIKAKFHRKKSALKIRYQQKLQEKTRGIPEQEQEKYQQEFFEKIENKYKIYDQQMEEEIQKIITNPPKVKPASLLRVKSTLKSRAKLKIRKPLRAKTALKVKTPLKTKTPLKAKTALKSKTPLKHKSEKNSPRKKIETASKLKQKLLTLIQKYVRLRDTDAKGIGSCISCGCKLHRTQGDGGHYISRVVVATAFDLNNINLQCKGCNSSLGGNQQGYRKGLIKKIGLEKVEELESQKHLIKHLDSGILKDEIAKYTSLVKQKEESKVPK